MHAPRMWVEENKEGHHACMLTFYPEIESNFLREDIEYIILLDCSCSMAEGTSLDEARAGALVLLHELPPGTRYNVVCFGETFDELFVVSQGKTDANVRTASSYVSAARPVWGSTELWRPLRALQLLSPSQSSSPRAVFLFSDGMASDAPRALALASAMAEHTRLFTFGVGAAPSRHFLRSLARVSGGAAEMLESSMKSRWRHQIKAQLERAAQPCLKAIEVCIFLYYEVKAGNLKKEV